MLCVLAFVLVVGVLPRSGAPCSVHHHTDGQLHVDCSNSHLTSHPVMWEGDVVWLDISHNQLAEFPDLSHPSLSRLRHLDVSHNVIKGLDQHALRGLSRLRSLDMSHNQLRVISSDTFSGPSCLETLLLDHNSLVRVDDDAFSGLSGLRSLRLDGNSLPSLSARTFRGLGNLTALDVSYNALDTLRNDTFSALVRLQSLQLHDNHLEKLEPSAFTGLSSLTEMNLNSNLLLCWRLSLPAGVFAPLRSVERFLLSDNGAVEVKDFPRGVFSDLVSVRHLIIDSFYDVFFDADFAGLSYVLTVDLSKECRAAKISNDSFLGFQNSSLETLIFYSCHLVHIETCAFCDLPHLKHLDLSSNPFLRPSVALLSLYGLQRQSMDEIDVSSVGRHLPEFHTLNRNAAQFLRNICVKRFKMTSCHLQRVASDGLTDRPNTQFARCIRDLDFSENFLEGDGGAIIRMMLYFKNLKSVRLQEQKLFSLKDSACIFSNNVNCDNVASGPSSQITFNFTVPTTLTYMNLSATFVYFNSPAQRMIFSNAYALKTLDISFGAISTCFTTFLGLDSLETFDISGSYCYNISDTIFDYLPSLRHLSLSSTHLQPTVIATRSQRLLQKLGRLETLNLARNWLTEVEGHGLPAQTKLRELNLAYNSFHTVPVDIGLHPNLTLLDLSFNTLTSLTTKEQQSLDSLAARHQFRLRLRGNPLLCACSNLHFLLWLWRTPVILDGEDRNHRRYTCFSDTGEMTDTERVKADWVVLWRRCIGQRVFGLALSAFFLQMLGLVLAYLVSRSWTHLKYAWYVLRHLCLPRRQDFRKDAYVVYADADFELACLKLPQCLEPYGVRLLLRDREDMPGSVLAENIVLNIEHSWKVLLLVTPSFAACDWTCGFTVQQAQRNITDTLPDRVLVVFLEEPRNLPPMASLELLLRNYPEKNVFHVPRNAPTHHSAWERLAKAILGEENK